MLYKQILTIVKYKKSQKWDFIHRLDDLYEIKRYNYT